MSPLSLRRYRAERLLRDEFEALRAGVLATVRARLRRHGAALDEADLEACYSLAWQGLYAAVLAGEEIRNPGGWLALVTYRRAIDEQRARGAAAQLPVEVAAADRDLAAEIDDRVKLRQLMEGLSARLSERERQAASLCYLQGLPRAEAAQRMGIGLRQMKKLMEGRGPDTPGVAAKVGALAETISAGRFCEEQASLMRALAFGVLDPAGERHRIALAHREACPACRAYVRSLRGLSAVLPPVFVPRLGGAGLGARGRGGAGHGGAAGGAPGGGAARRGGAALRGRVATALRGGPRAGAGSGLGLSGAKLAAVGAVLLGAGGGAIALTGMPADAEHRPTAGATVVHAVPAHGRSGARRALRPARSSAPSIARSGLLPMHAASLRGSRPSSASPAWREFGIERGGGKAGGAAAAGSPAAGSASDATASAPPPQPTTSASSARREFGIE